MANGGQDAAPQVEDSPAKMVAVTPQQQQTH